MYNEVKRNPVPEGKSANLRLDFYLGVAEFEVERYDATQDKFYEATLRIMPEGSREVESHSLNAFLGAHKLCGKFLGHTVSICLVAIVHFMSEGWCLKVKGNCRIIRL